jgi:perosamine synthetase
MPYLMPPAGFPISITDIVKMGSSRFKPEKNSDIFIDQIKKLTGTKYCFLFNLGRTALYHTLKALMRLSDSSKTEVVIPAYTCFTVAAPIARLGLKIRLVDIDPLTMDFDYRKLSGLNFKNVLAIVPSNLFGIISDWNELWSIGREHNVFIVDDAAQAMGSQFCNRPAGSLGDAGIFSLDRGKPLSTYLGGIMVTNNEDIAENVKAISENLDSISPVDECLICTKIIIYAILLNPHLYWLPAKMPFINLGQTFFDEHFHISGLSNFQKCAGAVMFPKLENVNIIRSRNAKAIGERLLADNRYHIPGYGQNNPTIYLRLPVLARNRAERDRAILTLAKNGIKASAMYPSTIRHIPGIEKYLAVLDNDFDGAQTVVDQLFTLPTHPYVKHRDIDRIVECLLEK